MRDPHSPPDDHAATRAFDPPPGADGVTRAFDRPGANGTTHTGAGVPVAEAGPPPEGVPGYAILRELGRGGMGVVYLARQTGLNRDVALKMVLSGGHASAAERIRFLAEAEAVAAVQHSGIVQVFDFGTHAGQPFFALEYLPGGSLADALQKALPEPKAAAKLIESLARAIHAAHQKGIVHRDLKPSNILLSADGSPKVTDFGLARKTDSGSGLTQTGAILGTPSYMSPEQAKGQHDQTGPATDVYALGALLYECLTGRPPFRAASAVETVQQVIRDEPVAPGKLVPKLPRDLETVCLKCLQKDAGKRYPSADALAEDLSRFLAGRPIHARPVPAWEKGYRWCKRNPSYLVAAGFMLGSVVASITLLASKNASLAQERNAARAAEVAAVQAENRSDQLRKLAELSEETARLNAILAKEERAVAQQRLEKAVQAVEQVMMRVAGEKWAHRAELQTERREVLEEAVNFFSGLGTAESKDPIVRKQAARANLFAATAYISLSDYDKCRSACEIAGGLYRGLREEFPTDSTFVRGELEVVALLGHSDAISARFTAALAHYENVLELAKKAIALEPDLVENQIAEAEAYSSLALFYSFQRPDLSRKYHELAHAIGKKLCDQPAPEYKARLVYASSLINIGVSEMGANGPGALTKLDAAKAQLDVMDRLAPPTARAAEACLLAKAGLGVYYGLFNVRRNRVNEGLAEMKDAIGLLERMLKVQPKSFPIRVQHIQFQIIYSDAIMNRGQISEAGRILEAVHAEQEAVAREFPQLTWIKGLGQVQRSNLIIHRMREKFDPGFESEVNDLLESANAQPSSSNSVKYNVACAFAQAALLSPPVDRNRYAESAMARLNELLKTTSYFQNEVNARHIDNDTDLDPIRNRPEYRVFAAAARMQAGIRESAPPPRKIELK